MKDGKMIRVSKPLWNLLKEKKKETDLPFWLILERKFDIRREEK